MTQTPKDYEYICRNCKARFDDNVQFLTGRDYSGNPRKHCPKCGGIIDSGLTKEAQEKHEEKFNVDG